MKTQDFRKLLLVGTAIVAVGAVAPIAATPAFAADEISVDADANGTFDGDELATSPFDWGTNTNGTGAAGEATDTFDVQVNADATIGGLQNGDTIGETGTNASAIFAGADALTLTLDDDVNDDGAEVVTINGNVNLNGQTSFNLTINGNDDDATGDAFTVDINGNVDLGTGTLTIDTDTNAGNTVGVNLSGNLTAAATVLSADNNALTLTIDGGGAQVIAGTINGGGANEGDVVVSNAAGTTFSGAIGGTAALDTITLTGAATTGFSSTVSVGTLSVDNAGATADVNGNLTGAVNFGADGTLDLAAGIDVSGAIDNDSGGDTIGTITLDSTGGTTIGGAVGSTNTLKLITANGTGTAAFSSTVAADDIDFGAAGTITFANDVTTANGLDFANNAGTVTFADNADLTGTIDSTGGSAGTLNFSGTSTVSGAVGATNALTAVNVNGASETVTFSSTLAATTVSVDAAGATLDLDGNLTGAINFGAAGTADLAAGVDVSGAIDNDSGGDGVGTLTLISTGGTTIGGNVGATNTLLAVNVGGTGTATFSGTVGATTTTISSTGTADFNDSVTSNIALSGDGVVDLAATKNITGTVDNTSGADGSGTLTVATTGGTNTISGAVGGTNSLKQGNINGTGTLAFSSTVNIDDLDFGGAATATFAADVTSANGIDFANNAGTATFADNADLTGNIISTGAANGTVNFSGTTTITGTLGTSAANGIAAINVNGASETVTITGNVFGTALTTVANSTYDGQGNTTLTGAVTNGGTINLGVGDTLTADGGFAGAGTYAVTLTDDGDGTLNAADYGSLASAGAIDLSAETVTFAVTGNVANGTAVFATGGAAATAGGTVTDDSFIHTVTLAANGNNIEVTVAQNTSSLSTTTNNQNVGTVLDSLAGTSNTELSQIQTQLAAATTAAALDEVLEATQPTVDGGAVAAGLGVVTSSTGMAQTRLASLRSGETGMAAGDSFTGRSIWGQIFGTTGEQDRRDNIDGYDIDTVGAAIGADTGDAGDDWVLGLALGYANSEVDSDNANNTQTDIDTYQVSLYGQYDVDDRTFVNAQVGYAYNDNETKRYNVGGVSGLTASGDYSSDVYYARAEIGRDYAQDAGLTLTPTLMANYVHYDAEDYTETGAGGANLTIDSDSMNIFELGIGLDAAWKTQTRDGGYIEPVLHAGVRHDLIGDEVEATSTFSGGGASFKTTGFDPAQTTFDVGAGVTYYAASNWEFVADYDYEAKSDYDSHSALLKAQYKF